MIFWVSGFFFLDLKIRGVVGGDVVMNHFNLLKLYQVFSAVVGDS